MDWITVRLFAVRRIVSRLHDPPLANLRCWWLDTRYCAVLCKHYWTDNVLLLSPPKRLMTFLSLKSLPLKAIKEVQVWFRRGTCPLLPHSNNKLPVPPKKLHTRLLHETAFCFDYGAHLLWHCFNKQCHNIYFHYINLHCIHFWPRFCIDDIRVKPFLQSFLLTPNNLNGVKVTIHVWKLLLMLHSFTTRAQWFLALSSWNMPEPSGNKKSIDGITWSFSIFRNSATCRA